ncbi:MAG: monovalent cation/H+ antiporter subunit D family protein [Desulfuromonadaceae bacterium]|nr:monovalent cation/H+ antiporter subunit D family protein [Desulfuromonadaceae bacterium]
MNVIDSLMPLMVIGAALLCVVPIILAGRKPVLRGGLTISGAVVVFALVASMLPDVLDGRVFTAVIAPVLPGAYLKLRVDAMGFLFAMVASFLWILTAFYSIGYMGALKEHAQTRFFAFFAVAIAAALGVAFSANLLTLYLFYEILSLSTYPLVAHDQTPEAYAAGRKYLIYLLGTSVAFVLPALVLIYTFTGTLDFADNIRSGIFPATTPPALVVTVYILCLFGFAKSAIMPLHGWLPSAMVAPTPVSALLHAVAVVKVGVFSTTRVMLYLFGVETMEALNLGIPTAYFVSITIIVASLIALTRDNLKARLAYSTISQLSYIILGVALLTPEGISGGLIHIANHAFSKITLFFCAGAIYVASHKKNISEMGGLGRAMPFTFAAFGIASLSMIGGPPVAGFVTKWYLFLGAMEASQIGIMVVLVISTLLNIGYFAPIVYRAFFASHDAADRLSGEKWHEAPLFMVIPLCCAALVSVLIGIFPGFLMTFVRGVFG